MNLLQLPRAARLMPLFALAMVGMTVQAESTPSRSHGRFELAQAVEGTAPAASPAVEQAPAPAPSKEAVPDVMPGLNKKRVAFWGVVTMTVTSLIFTVFGAWAIWKTPKPGQQRPDSYEKRRAS